MYISSSSNMNATPSHPQPAPELQLSDGRKLRVSGKGRKRKEDEDGLERQVIIRKLIMNFGKALNLTDGEIVEDYQRLLKELD